MTGDILLSHNLHIPFLVSELDGCNDISYCIGSTATGVIDPETGTWYLTTKTYRDQPADLELRRGETECDLQGKILPEGPGPLSDDVQIATTNSVANDAENTPVALRGIAVSETGPWLPDGSLVAGPYNFYALPTSVLVCGSLTITVNFNPTANGNYGVYLLLKSNGGNKYVTIVGTSGGYPAAKLEFGKSDRSGWQCTSRKQRPNGGDPDAAILGVTVSKPPIGAALRMEWILVKVLPGESADATLFCSVPKPQINVDSHIATAQWTMNLGDPNFGKHDLKFICLAKAEQGGPLYANGQGRYRYLGCFKENNPRRQLEQQLYGSNTLTNGQCMQDCFVHAKEFYICWNTISSGVLVRIYIAIIEAVFDIPHATRNPPLVDEPFLICGETAASQSTLRAEATLKEDKECNILDINYNNFHSGAYHHKHDPGGITHGGIDYGNRADNYYRTSPETTSFDDHHQCHCGGNSGQPSGLSRCTETQRGNLERSAGENVVLRWFTDEPDKGQPTLDVVGLEEGRVQAWSDDSQQEEVAAATGVGEGMGQVGKSAAAQDSQGLVNLQFEQPCSWIQARAKRLMGEEGRIVMPVKGHSGVKGNETVDRKAKERVDRKEDASYRPLLWGKSKQTGWSREALSGTAYIVTDRDPQKWWLHMVGRTEDPMCRLCDQEVAQNAAHLLKCPGMADGSGRQWEQIWDDLECCERLGEILRA
ncbi:hypothetical protein EV426DRAFT_707167 [Tirmania nivea]|nr:hypothetical protein EV426DRAFT_707167 [Tirmania nivea]